MTLFESFTQLCKPVLDTRIPDTRIACIGFSSQESVWAAQFDQDFKMAELLTRLEAFCIEERFKLEHETLIPSGKDTIQ